MSNYYLAFCPACGTMTNHNPATGKCLKAGCGIIEPDFESDGPKAATPTPPQSERCQHPSFNAKAEIYRLTDDDDGRLTGFSAEVKISCMECDMPFQWLGLKGGLSPSQPMVSADTLTLRAPITPLEEL